MLQWKGFHGNYVHLAIEGYSLPNASDGYDANWLKMAIEAQNEQGVWKKTCSCILSWEVMWYARWIENVVVGNCENNELTVLEHDFGLVYLTKAQGFHRFQVYLRSGLGFKNVSEEERDTSIIGVCLTNTEIEEAVHYFNEIFQTYPPRGKHGKTVFQSLSGPKIFA